MNLFRKKSEEVVLKKEGKRGKKLPKIESTEELSQHFGDSAPPLSEDNPYDVLYMPDDSPEITGNSKEKHKKEKRERGEKRPKVPKSEVPFYRNRLVLGAVSVAAACLIAFVLVPVMNYVTTTELTTVARVTAPVGKGQKIEPSALRTEEVPAMGVPSGALRDASLAAGKYAAVDLVEGDYLMPSKLSDSIPFADGYLYEIPPEKQAVSVTIQSFAGGLSGKLLPDDVVALYAVPNQTDPNESDYHAVQPPELRYLRVLAVTDKLGGDKEQTENSSSSSSAPTDEESQPLTVTLLVDTTQAAAIAGLEVNARLHLTLVTRGDAQASAEYLTVQEDYLKEQAELAKEEESEPDEFLDALDALDSLSGLDTPSSEATASESEAADE